MRNFLIALFLAASLNSAFAVQPDEILKDPALEARARNLSTGLRCLICQNQSIDDSDASLAKDLRVLIRERLAAGDSDKAVMDYVVGRYGEFVLLKPRFAAKTAILWGTPFAIILIGGLLMWRRRPPESVSERALSAEEKRALEDTLRAK
jgi:cytochrome c-type biogenesis protein CcmH